MAGEVVTLGKPLVRFEGVTKRFGKHAAVADFSLDIGRNEFFALLGPSGCGKTTLLRMLAGFETPDAGRILLEGEDIVALPPHLRPVNMMFQSYALFPHLTVADNVAFGLKQEKLPRKEMHMRVNDMLCMVKMEEFSIRKPHQLSGGQRQRVALARALVKRPKVFLLDEPLAALDKKLRTQTQSELRDLQKKLGITFIIVTHDQEEAMTMADRIAVMNNGKLAQVAPPRAIYEHPASRWVAEFIGDVNLLEGTVSSVDAQETVVETASAGKVRVGQGNAAHRGDRVTVAIRPEKIAIARSGLRHDEAASAAQAGDAAAAPNSASGVLIESSYFGDISVYKVKLDGPGTMRVASANITRADAPVAKPGERVTLSWAADAGTVLTQ
jgi:putrescine transport system ATP-binding protein